MAETDQTTHQRGLSPVEAARRLANDGLNSLPSHERSGLWPIIWRVVREPMFLLLVAAGSLYLVMGSPGDAAMLLGFVFVIMGITIVQERRTERALAALRELASPQALVVRDGTRVRIPASDLVSGDLIVVAEGDRIPADAILRTAINLSVDESLLTGEAVPVLKAASTTATSIDRPGGDGLPAIFSGTLITAGQGLAEVLATGPRTELGKIGKALSQLESEPTRLQQETGRLVRLLAIVGLSLCAVVVAVYALTRGGDLASWKQGLLAGITMAMAVLPEEFPVIVAIFLALGAWRISHHRVLTRRMPAIEALGATTVLCTDKTGTLTRNQMTVTQLVIAGQQIDLARAPGSSQSDLRGLLEIAVLASRPDPFDPMERAIHTAGARFRPSSQGQHPGWKLEREYPLTPRLLAVIQAWRCESGKPLLIAAKGAPEAIVGLCGLPANESARVIAQATAMASDGLRVLGVARGTCAVDALPAHAHAFTLEFIGLIGLADPLRENVPAAVAECQAAGIRVVMITGDYPATAQSIARQAGIANPHEVITGPEIALLTDQELARRIATVHIFARVVPEQKLRLVQALKADGEVVAMTGDGVNDAPALKAAHIGIAMGGRGTDVAREAAALVLLDDDFASIVTAIKLGRRIFDNIKKAIAFTFAVHVPIAGLSMLPVFIPGWPLILLPVHIVFLELVIDPSCTLIFEAEDAEADLMRRPPRPQSERLYSWRGIGLSLLQGASSLAVCVGIFVTVRALHGDDEARTVTFVALVASFIAIIVTNRSWSRGFIAILRTPNAAQRWVILGTAALLTVVVTLPVARTLFQFALPPRIELVLALIAGILSIGWFEGLKYWRRRHAKSHT